MLRYAVLVILLATAWLSEDGLLVWGLLATATVSCNATASGKEVVDDPAMLHQSAALHRMDSAPGMLTLLDVAMSHKYKRSKAAPGLHFQQTAAHTTSAKPSSASVSA